MKTMAMLPVLHVNLLLLMIQPLGSMELPQRIRRAVKNVHLTSASPLHPYDAYTKSTKAT